VGGHPVAQALDVLQDANCSGRGRCHL
jgi:hypothetical protein